MSNPLRKSRKGDKSPAVRWDEFAKTEQNIQRLNYALVDTIYNVRHINTRLYHLLRFLLKKGIIAEEEYNQFLQEEKRKLELAQEIAKDESLTREQKIAKAKDNDILEDWVVEPEPQPQPATGEQAAQGREESSRIILPPGVRV